MTMNDYVTMWRNLGIDIEAHDGLLAVLSQSYADVFLSQQNRPKGMEYLDFVISEIHGLRIHELVEAKEQGRRVIGTFCLYVPEEIILAADAACVGLCAGADIGGERAEQVLPRNTCALIKSFFGFKLGKVCPYVEVCDFVIGETTCDGKKKAYEIFNDYKETFVLEIPQMKSPQGRMLWRSEVRRLLAKVEEATGKKIDEKRLRKGIEIVNAKRAVLQRLNSLRGADPAPISGRDALLINQVQFYDDPLRFTGKIAALCDEIEERIEKGEGVSARRTPRILISGCPMAAPNWKLPFLVEKNGAVIVGEESCVGERGTRNLVDTSGETLDQLLDAIADRYLQIDCAVFTPNRERIDHVKEMARYYGADGVIHYGIQFCTPYAMEANQIEQALKDERLPILRIETDYSSEDVAQIETRVQAFLELIGEGARKGENDGRQIGG